MGTDMTTEQECSRAQWREPTFVVDVFSPGPTSLHLHLNKTKVASLHVSDYQKKGYLQMSRTIVLKVNKEDGVGVVTTPIHPGHSITMDIPDFPELRCTDFFGFDTTLLL